MNKRPSAKTACLARLCLSLAAIAIVSIAFYQLSGRQAVAVAPPLFNTSVR